MAINSQDEKFMGEALDLAREGTALASPGARVGALVVTAKGDVAGRGFYIYDAIDHAEVLALRQAGDAARGGTLYLTLEPHGYQSKTPPCTDAIIAAGIKRVVAAMTDPNPQVAGRGLAQLRAAGLNVETGLMEKQGRKLDERL